MSKGRTDIELLTSAKTGSTLHVLGNLFSLKCTVTQVQHILFSSIKLIDSSKYVWLPIPG